MNRSLALSPTTTRTRPATMGSRAPAHAAIAAAVAAVLAIGPGLGFAETYLFSHAWGDPPTLDGQFASPTGVAADPLGNVFVLDAGNGRIQKFDTAGAFLGKWDSDAAFIATDVLGRVYAAGAASRVVRFDGHGVPDEGWQTPYQLLNGGIAVDAAQHIYVTNYPFFGEAVYKFDGDGNYVTSWGAIGSGDGQFDTPRGVAVDALGFVYVVDRGSHRV